MKNRLLQILSTRKLERKDLSEICDIAYSQVTRWINGQTNPSADSLKKIHDKLNINIHWLLTGEGDMDYRRESMVRESAASYGFDCEKYHQDFLSAIAKLEGDILKQGRVIEHIEQLCEEHKKEYVSVRAKSRIVKNAHDP